MLKNLNQRFIQSCSWQNSLNVILLALIYFASGKASFSYAISHEIVTLVVFAAGGFALAATILFGRKIIPGIFLGQLVLAHSNDLSLSIALALAITNATEALIGYEVFKLLSLHPNLDRIQDISRLHLLIFLILQPLNATLSTMILYLGGIVNLAESHDVWISLWLGNSLGQVLIAPLTLSIFASLPSIKLRIKNKGQKFKFIRKSSILQSALALGIIMVVGWLMFYLPNLGNVSTVFAITMPLLVLIAVWQGMSVVSISVFMISAIAIKATSEQIGPFATGNISNLLDLHVFLLGIILTTQYVAVIFSELRQAEAQLRLSASVFEYAYEGIVILDEMGKIIKINPVFMQIVDCPGESIIGQNLAYILTKQHEESFCKKLWETVQAVGFWRGEVLIGNQSGSAIPNLMTVSMVDNPRNQTVYYTALFSNISNLKQKQSKYKHLALFDQLTGLPNRRLLLERLQKEIKTSHKKKKMVGVCYIDLDGFKLVNDTLGHEAGDKLLIAITSRFQDCLRENDTLARIGGDEFVIVLSDIESVNQCKQIVQRIIDTASVPILIEQETANVSASVGVTIYPHDRSNDKTLLRHADSAMYLAKAIGKARYCLFDPETEIIYNKSNK